MDSRLHGNDKENEPSEGLKPSEGSEIQIYNNFGELVLSDVAHLKQINQYKTQNLNINNEKTSIH